MKKLFVAVVFLSILLILGCSKNAPSLPKDDSVPVEESKPEEPSANESKVEEAPEQTRTVGINATVSGVSIDPSVQVFLNKTKKVKGYSYVYYGPPDDSMGYGFYARGNLSKMRIPKTDFYNDSFFDTIYFDAGRKTAVGYCESLGVCNDQKSAVSLDFSKVYRVTPLEFTSSIRSASVNAEKSSEMIGGRRVEVIDFTDSSGSNGTVWLDSTYGIPVKVIIGSLEYEYRDLLVNVVTEEEVVHKEVN
ncbi:hypothetical protein HYU11_01830 [Candidatus Woesearchaeota archaeon]|nr:hypothetical protein [Candidatus Woesearchaeota archaeon]